MNRLKRYLPLAIIIIVLAAAVALALHFWRSETGNTDVANTSLANNMPANNARTPMLRAATGASPAHIRGATTANVTVEEFADFQCPPCGILYPQLKTLESEFGTRVRFVFRNFPLERMHPNALVAARAAEAAGRQNKFWEMHDLLYQNQTAWANVYDAQTIFNGYATSLGLDVERFKQDLQNPETLARIRADQQRGASLGVTGTPTVLINNRLVAPNDTNESGLRAAINAALGSGTTVDNGGNIASPTPVSTEAGKPKDK